MGRLTLLLLSAYKNLVSPLFEFFFGHACRFTPSCSEYARESIQKYGLIRGAGLALKRLSRCHPFSNYSTLDPVPEVLSSKMEARRTEERN